MLSPLERGLALALALVWLCGGAFASYFALAYSHWGMAIGGFAALLYGAAWLRVAAFSRLLTWRELIAPWKRVGS
jgi:O-antigen/teichoic acid export membrane protein